MTNKSKSEEPPKEPSCTESSIESLETIGFAWLDEDQDKTNQKTNGQD
jgi:hypothetical protein